VTLPKRRVRPDHFRVTKWPRKYLNLMIEPPKRHSTPLRAAGSYPGVIEERRLIEMIPRQLHLSLTHNGLAPSVILVSNSESLFHASVTVHSPARTSVGADSPDSGVY
jgi:hypothetical protein